MPPITFSCRAELHVPPAALAEAILRVENWADFGGFGPIPGIAAAEFETREPGEVGTRIRVSNRDGSRHVEEIKEWKPEHRLVLEMKEFSPPLSRLADRIVETWDVEASGDTTRVCRSFAMFPKRWWATPVLWILSFFLKAAVARHLRQVAGGPKNLGAETAGASP